jgi:phosphoglycolate phosphatase
VLERRGLHAPSRARFLRDFHLPLASLLGGYGARDGAGGAVEDWNREMAKRPTRATPGAKRMLEWCSQSGVVVAVVSAASPAVIERHLALLDLRDHVSAVFGDAEPKRVALAELGRRYGAPVSYLGDTEYDMEEARAADAIAIGFSGGYRPSAALVAAGASWVADRLDEVVPFMLERLSLATPPESSQPTGRNSTLEKGGER